MFTLYFVSIGWIIRNIILMLLVGAVMSSPSSAETIEEIAGETQVATTGHVTRAIFTTAIVDREPVDTLKTLSTTIDRVFFFTDLRGLSGQIVTHRWEHNGQAMAEITFKVGSGARWRVYSSKNLLPEWTGTWKVAINNESGETLYTRTFEYAATTATAE